MVGARPGRLPISIGAPARVSGTLAVCPMYELFAWHLQRGLVTVGFIGGAKVDRFGNVNVTVIGECLRPKVRPLGAGGGDDLA